MARPRKEVKAIRTEDYMWEIVNKDDEILGYAVMQDWTKLEFKAFGYKYQSDFIVDVYYRQKFGSSVEIDEAGGLANYLKNQGKEYPKIKRDMSWLEDYLETQNLRYKKAKTNIDFIRVVPENNGLSLNIKELEGKSFDDIAKFFEYVKTLDLATIYDLDNEKWSENYEGYSSKIRNGRFLFIDKTTKKGYVFDLMDLIREANMSLYDFALLNNIEIRTVKRYYEELKNYDDLINAMEEEVLKDYKSLYKLIKNYTWFIKELAIVGRDIIADNVNLKFVSDLDKPVFYKSTRYFSDYLTNSKNRSINHQNTSKLFNLITILGLFNKHFNVKELNFNSNPEHKYEITYFSVPKLDLQKANEIAKVLIENKFRMNSFSSKFIRNIFGDEFVDKIYSKPRVTKLEAKKDKIINKSRDNNEYSGGYTISTMPYEEDDDDDVIPF